jgi:hypothetical protein
MVTPLWFCDYDKQNLHILVGFLSALSNLLLNLLSIFLETKHFIFCRNMMRDIRLRRLWKGVGWCGQINSEHKTVPVLWNISSITELEPHHFSGNTEQQRTMRLQFRRYRLRTLCFITRRLVQYYST